MLKGCRQRLQADGMNDTLFIKEADVHEEWHAFLSAGNLNLLASIEAGVSKTGYTPAADKVLRFLKVPLQSVKIIILGQDPYPQPGVATGRAFEVGTLRSWSQPFRNVSLKNILRALYKAYKGEVISFGQLKEKLYTHFPVLPPGQLFEYWESQGILLLNTSYTCIPGKPGSHQKAWKPFTERLLPFIAEQVPEATWFVWGNHAAEAIKYVQPGKLISSLHPMMCFNTPGRENDFLFGETNCFEQFIPEVDWTGFAFYEASAGQIKLF